MPLEKPVYTLGEKPDNHLVLSDIEKQKVREITLGIEEVDPFVREMATDDVIRTLENGHPLNRVIYNEEKGISGYIACEDFIPHEAYIKYVGTDKTTGRSLLTEIPAFLEYSASKGYTTLNFHGWNSRLNHVMERFGFTKLRTDSMGGFNADYFEKKIVADKNPEEAERQRTLAFEQKFLTKLAQEYQKTLATFSEDKKPEKERIISDTFKQLSTRLQSEGTPFGERQQAVLKLKLARYFQTNENIDLNVLQDAIVESPKFLDTDKGSLHRLFEVHEEKTLIAIAERRKRKAEQNGEGFNPYEALFTTDSGKYYLARLLNMPHLKNESDYMKHCVGNSDSYINRMKRGEIEILSFRNMPTISPITNKLVEDTPLLTIQYNLKTRAIVQMKKYDDKYLLRGDPYFADVVEALGKLRETIDDTGAYREIKSINDGELSDITVKDYYVQTSKGQIFFREYNPDKDGFILKAGNLPITAETSKEDTAKILRIVKGIEIEVAAIAYSADELNAGTRVYIGPLGPDIFSKFPPELQHIYTSFPEGKISLSDIEFGGKSVESLEQELKKAGIRFSDFYGDIESMLHSSEFISSNLEKAVVVRLTVGDLGFSGRASLDQIYTRAKEFGLELLPHDAAIQYRLDYKEMSSEEGVEIGMKQILASSGKLKIFSLFSFPPDENGLRPALATSKVEPNSSWRSKDRFVFLLRK